MVAGNAGMAMPVAAPGGTGEEQVIETVSALEQLSRCDHSHVVEVHFVLTFKIVGALKSRERVLKPTSDSGLRPTQL